MSDIIPNVVVSMPSQQFTLARKFQAASNGKIYIGQIDKDPTLPENQIQVYLENEDGSTIPVAQPLIIGVGGYPIYNGQIAKYVTVEGHSMAVYNAYGEQQFYYPNVLKYDPDQFEQRFRSELKSNDGANMIGAKNGKTVQDNIDELNESNKTTELIKNNVDGYQYLSDIEINKTSITPKMIIKRSNGGIFILTKNNDGYVRYYMKDGEGDAVPNKNLFRVLDVAQYANVLVSTNSKPTTNEGGKLYVDRGNAIFSHFTKFGNAAIPETFITSILEAATLGSGQKCSYKFKTFSSNASVTLYASSASTSNAKIVIKSSNGVTEVMPVAICYSSNAGILHIPVAVPYSETVDNEVEIIIQNGGTTALYVLGVNLIELSSAAKGMSVAWAVGFSDTSSKSYQSGLGASDYAFFDVDANLWVGSYHGYETRNKPMVFLCDRKELDISAMATDEAVIANNIIIKQDNRLNDKIDIYSEHSFSDNAMNMQVIMRNGSIKCSQAYICMNTTNPTYKNIDYPIIFKSSAAEDKYFNRKSQTCTQSNDETGQSVDISHTLIWGEKTSQYVRFEGNYSKYYYGLIVNGSQEIKDLSWIVKRTYTR